VRQNAFDSQACPDLYGRAHGTVPGPLVDWGGDTYPFFSALWCLWRLDLSAFGILTAGFLFLFSKCMQSVQYFEKFWGHITLTFDPSDKKMMSIMCTSGNIFSRFEVSRTFHCRLASPNGTDKWNRQTLVNVLHISGMFAQWEMPVCWWWNGIISAWSNKT